MAWFVNFNLGRGAGGSTESVDLKPSRTLRLVANCSCTCFFTCSVTYFYDVNASILRKRNLSRCGRTQTFCFLTARRIQEDISTVLKPVSLILDGKNEVTVLFPRMNIDLFDRLQDYQENPIGLLRGLSIVQQMTDALENCWIRGFHHVDLRITNVLVRMSFTHFFDCF